MRFLIEDAVRLHQSIHETEQCAWLGWLSSVRMTYSIWKEKQNRYDDVLVDGG